MLSTKQIGTITEYECAICLMKLGCIVSFPLGEDAKYDLIADYRGVLLRIQVKHSSPINGGFVFNCTSTHINATKIECRTYSEGEFDYFGTVFDGICYLVPLGSSKSSKTLRLEKSGNNQVKNICWASEYEAKHVLDRIVIDCADIV